jgi:carboxylate-amine ligase
MTADTGDLKSLVLRPSADHKTVVLRTDVPWNGTGDDFTFGIEEEYFLADAGTLEAPETTPEGLFQAAGFVTGGQSMQEFIQAQVEVATNVHASLGDARQELQFLRREVARVAAEYNLVIMASGTHPTASWRRMNATDKPRYADMMDDLQIVGRRDLVCGMHVHVQLPDAGRRVDVMRRMIPWLPLFLALSASSPFWHGRATGLKAYRLALYDELPRSGVPELFASEAEFTTYVKAMMAAGAIRDGSYIWWMVRPSWRQPTLELRACDCCTSIDDVLALTALYRALARRLYRDSSINAGIDTVDRALAVENKWRAQRYGVQGSFVTRRGAVSVSDVLDDLMQLVAPDAAALDCLADLERCRTIIARGTSADQQLAVHAASPGDLHAVSRWIADTTLGGLRAGQLHQPAA